MLFLWTAQNSHLQYKKAHTLTRLFCSQIIDGARLQIFNCSKQKKKLNSRKYESRVRGVSIQSLFRRPHSDWCQIKPSISIADEVHYEQQCKFITKFVPFQIFSEKKKTKNKKPIKNQILNKQRKLLVISFTHSLQNDIKETNGS